MAHPRRRLRPFSPQPPIQFLLSFPSSLLQQTGSSTSALQYIASNMDVRRQFPTVHWIWGGGISSVYEVHPLIVVKVPKPGEFEREQFQRELKIYEAFSQHPPCPSVVQCFHYTNNGIFLEYMRGETLFQFACM